MNVTCDASTKYLLSKIHQISNLVIAILSTSRGVMSDRQAKKAKVGGEILCTVW